MAAEGNGDPPVPDLRTMEELCQPSLNGRGGPIAPIAIQATNFGLKNDMIQQVHNSCQFHGLSEVLRFDLAFCHRRSCDLSLEDLAICLKKILRFVLKGLAICLQRLRFVQVLTLRFVSLGIAFCLFRYCVLSLLRIAFCQGSRTESGFKRVFATLSGQDTETFTCTMFLNVEQLEKQFDKEDFQEIRFMAAFKVNERQMKTIEEKVDTSKVLDASSVDTECSRTESKEQDTSSRSGNDAHNDDADMRPIYDEEPMAEVQMTAKIDVFAI
nr:reverse transcriptase domain-containing protein [Tanacetum cinerariifolium]